MPSELQNGCANPERIIVGHPMNPPHLIPVVEIVLGKACNQEISHRAKSFYNSLQRVPVQIKKEMRGHLANRLNIRVIQRGCVSGMPKASQMLRMWMLLCQTVPGCASHCWAPI
ncbi:MAG: 3-hydroxyacyl-CoA dehydrogenase NAD-binding domain-containing protein [Paracoccaceae bacterium]